MEAAYLPTKRQSLCDQQRVLGFADLRELQTYHRLRAISVDVLTTSYVLACPAQQSSDSWIRSIAIVVYFLPM